MPRIELGTKSSDRGSVKTEAKQEYNPRRHRSRNDESESLEKYKHKKEYRSGHREDRSSKRKQRSESSQSKRRTKREYREPNNVKTEHVADNYPQQPYSDRNRGGYDDINVKFEDAN